MLLKSIIGTLRKYLIAGLLLWVPILVTIWVIRFFVQILDKSFELLPQNYQPVNLLGVDLPGLGIIFCLLILFFTGMFVTNFVGKQLVKLGDYIINRIPLVRSIYTAVKQVMETLFHGNSQAFRKVLLVEYPRKGSWSIAFQTAEASAAINEETGEEMVGVFVPTTPNPTSGFLIFLPKSEVRNLAISTDDALKMVVSLGVIQPSAIQHPPAVINTGAE